MFRPVPVKKDKPSSDVPDPSTYVTLERELLRLHLVGSNQTPDDAEFTRSLRTRFSPEAYRICCNTFRFRHPLVGKVRQHVLNILPDLTLLNWPSQCLDIFGTSFVSTSCASPDLSYSRYELIRTLLECHRVYPDLGDAPVSCQETLDQIPEDTLKAYNDFYAITHPEFMGELSDDRQTVIKTAYISRTLDTLL